MTCPKRMCLPMLLALATTATRPPWPRIPRNSLRFASKLPSEPKKRKHLSVVQPEKDDPPPDRWNYNSSSLIEGDAKPREELAAYPLVDANALEKCTAPPRQVKMLVRDWIEDSLYNPHYGYFPKQAVIFDTADTAFDFPALRNAVDFDEEVARRYAAYGADEHYGPGRQIWHTPTELFKPWYGIALAKCLVSEYLLKYFPYEDFIIYEIGAGNGTLAMNILDYLRSNHPEVYDRTRYNIIEISGSLVELQRKKLATVHPCVTVVHQSIFRWQKTEPAPCFVVAMEVIDNFAHDMVRYDLKTLQPMQALVTVDERGDFDMLYTPVTDPLIAAFLKLRTRLAHPPALPRLLRAAPSLLRAYSAFPFAPNLSQAEYLPTRLLTLLRTLRARFPRHRLLLSDFASVPDALPGHGAPVVQTRFRNTTVPVSTLLVAPGFFDIFFPTDFGRLRDMYEHVLAQPPEGAEGSYGGGAAGLGADYFSSYHPSTRRRPVPGVKSASGLPVGERKSAVFTHAQFLATYADLSRTRLKDGGNPMLDFYQNVKFLF
ncbi:S-adenosyl-L-methionine-dependent methyltransferase [Mycena rosella]|uniref:Protein arginine methyltransferase NDUFAF7 n=1 Tax=Mycena rosella TaxID=1033263 RepID=A0AAD7MAV4_MYCRO|nr:S-adenosyl-L-methionine-dependent methyltransferase [Mycena rosella]